MKSSIHAVKRNEGVAPQEFVRQPRRIMAMERVCRVVKTSLRSQHSPECGTSRLSLDFGHGTVVLARLCYSA